MQRPDTAAHLLSLPGVHGSADLDRHVWLTAPEEKTRGRLAARLLGQPGTPPLLATLDAHRRLRGPYTAAGSLMRQIVPESLARVPMLAPRHDIEILTAAPELSAVLPCTRETMTSLAEPERRTRYYPYIRTTRIAHGLLDFLDACLPAPATLLIEHAEHADRTDADWIAVLLRRADPRRLRLIVCTATSTPPAPLDKALSAHACHLAADGHPKRPGTPRSQDPAESRQLAAAFVNEDCTADDPHQRACYGELTPSERASLHDRRADALEATAAAGEESLRYGALPFHRERGSDPTGAGTAALRDTLRHYVLQGFYDAVIELGARSLDLLDWSTQPEECWLVTVRMAIACCTMGGRADEALALYDAACAATSLPGIHMSAAYGRAMVYTRYLEPERRDHTKAKAWVNTAVALSELSSTENRRIYNRTFNENGLALIEMHLGEPAKALQLVEAGIARFDSGLDTDEQGQHRSVLEYNRAQLLVRLKGPQAAVEAYDRVITQDPNHSDYYFERAPLLRLLGRYEDALADYGEAIRTAPPYPEPVYNRADLLAELGDATGALRDLDRVLDLDPEFLDAYVNRAALLYENGDPRGAAGDIAAGLEREPTEPHLLCLRGLLAQDDGRPDDARTDFERALHADPHLAGAWANLGVLAFERGDLQESLHCFDEALKAGEDPAVRSNRALALEHSGRREDAAADYATAIDALPAEEAHERTRLMKRRSECLGVAGEQRTAADG